MAFNINEIRELLEINRSEMTNDRDATNDLIIDDLMVELGYNRKRDKSVKRLHNESIDWEVLSATGSRIAVKVFAIGEPLSQQELDTAMKFSADKRFSIFLVSNGEALTICRYQKERGEYAEVCDISFTQESLDDKQTNCLSAIAKDTWDLQLIDSLIVKYTISDDKIIDIIKSSLDDICKVVITKLGNISDLDKEHCENIVTKFLSKDDTDSKAQTDNDNTNNIINELTRELNETKSELNSTRDKLIEAQEAQEKHESHESGPSDIEKDKRIADLEAQVKELTATMVSDDGEKDTKIEELEEEVHRLKRKLNSTSMFTTGDENIDNKINNYRDQINDLTIKIANYEEQVEELEGKLKEAQDEINNMAGIEKKRAHELLMVIEDDPNMDRHYVGVVNTELLQYDDIHTFVGRSLQKLYEIKRLEASQYIFNGDIFKLSQPAVRNDLIMNNKQYDVNFSDMYEDEVLNKLRILFSHFDDVVFECRKIGTLREKTWVNDSAKSTVDVTGNNDDIASEIAMMNSTNDLNEEQNEESDDTLGDDNCIEVSADEDLDTTENIVYDSDEENEQEDKSNTETLDNSDEPIFDDDENIEKDNSYDKSLGETSDEAGYSFDIPANAFEEQTDSDSQQFNNGFSVDGQSEDDNLEAQDNEINDFGETVNNSEMTEKLLVAQLLQIDRLIWMEDVNINFKNIKYIGSNSVTFNINKDGDKVSNEQLLCKCVDAIMAIESYNGNSGIVQQLKQTDFSQINNFLHLYTKEYNGYPRINGTKYIASDVSTIQSVCSTLYDICNYMNIPMEEIFVYTTVDTDSQFIIDNYGYSEDAVQLRDYSNCEMNPDSKVIAIIKGDLFNNIVVTKNSLKAHKDIVIDALVVKTEYLAKALNSRNDLVETVVEMLIKASERGRINLAAVGNVIGENYRVISDKQYDVGPDPVEITADGNVYYLANLENWQVLHTLIKLHTTLFGNIKIAVKIVANADAINFYGQNFDTSEPSLSLAVRSFADYVAASVKR